MCTVVLYHFIFIAYFYDLYEGVIGLPQEPVGFGAASHGDLDTSPDVSYIIANQSVAIVPTVDEYSLVLVNSLRIC